MMFDPGSPSGSSTSSKRTAHFIIEAASPEDVRRLVDIEFQAFENERVNHYLSFRDYTKPEHFQRSVLMYAEALQAPERQHQPTKGHHRSDSGHVAESSPKIAFLKVTDVEAGEIVSFAKTEIKGYTLDELRSPEDAGHEHEPRMNRDWFALNERLRREYLGQAKHCYIGMLATQPCYQHNGAGTMLLNAILKEADKAGIEVYLEGTDTAKPLYEKHGFEAVNEVRFDPAKYGLHDIGKERQTVMVRGALGRDGRRKQVRTWDAAVAHAKVDLKHAMATK